MTVFNMVNIVTLAFVSGIHKINVTYLGAHIDQSPYEVSTYSPKLVHLSKMPLGILGIPFKFRGKSNTSCLRNDKVSECYSKTCVKQPLSKRQKIGFQDQLLLNAGQKYCRILPLEHFAKLLTFIKLPFVIKIFVLSIFEWPFYTDFTVSSNATNTDLRSWHHKEEIESTNSHTTASTHHTQTSDQPMAPQGRDKECRLVRALTSCLNIL